jgi:hypothetical protein
MSVNEDMDEAERILDQLSGLVRQLKKMQERDNRPLNFEMVVSSASGADILVQIKDRQTCMKEHVRRIISGGAATDYGCAKLCDECGGTGDSQPHAILGYQDEPCRKCGGKKTVGILRFRGS